MLDLQSVMLNRFFHSLSVYQNDEEEGRSEPPGAPAQRPGPPSTAGKPTGKRPGGPSPLRRGGVRPYSPARRDSAANGESECARGRKSGPVDGHLRGFFAVEDLAHDSSRIGSTSREPSRRWRYRPVRVVTERSRVEASPMCAATRLRHRASSSGIGGPASRTPILYGLVLCGATSDTRGSVCPPKSGPPEMGVPR